MFEGATVELSGVDCTHGRRTVVRGVDLRIPGGERVALTGTNGSGKTTLLRAILGLHPLAGGTITVGGATARTAQDWDLRRRAVAWIPQRQAAGRFPLPARELLHSSGAFDAAMTAAHDLGVSSLAARPLHTLSGGQLQRMYLARALGCVAAGAGVLLADEPTAALDFAGQEDAAKLLTDIPVTLLVVTHDRALAARCDRVLEMAGGSLREITSREEDAR
ncbi:ABC transporter ATP-binding protein [Nocardia sp. BSTN01]|uniref:metal ABC transporter ATP-binding protein n=1 Tax=Nocardia sp. BSTN01 TaxID=2783665 RepID=UPI00188E2FF9|nr:ABC transporter ATP-binding protein [Nocardia sp. BSTN01]MBF4996641.1 ABC transporter ATP-binding protein [Nocardia sp. BSTN01]